MATSVFLSSKTLLYIYVWIQLNIKANDDKKLIDFVDSMM